MGLLLGKKQVCLVLVLFGLLAAGTACSSQAVEHSPGPPLIAPAVIRIDSTWVERGTVSSLAVHPGLVRTHSVPVYFEASSGILGEFLVFPGAEVRQGDVIARIDASALQQQIESQEERIANLRWQHEVSNAVWAIEHDIADIEITNQMRIAAENFNQAGMDAAERRRLDWELSAFLHNQTQQNQAMELDDALERLAELQAQVPDLELFAPFDGSVTNMHIGLLGTWVNAGSTVMYMANAQQELFIEFVGNPLLTAFVDRPFIHVEGYVGGRSYVLEHIPATEMEWVSFGGGDDRLMPSYWRFDLPAGAVLPIGTYVTMHFYFDWEYDVLRVPPQAVFFAGDVGDYVYRMVDGALVMTPVQTGLRTETFIVILSGLEEGDEIFAR